MKKILLLVLVALSFGITKTSASDIAQGQPGTVCVEGFNETRCFDEKDVQKIEEYKNENSTEKKFMFMIFISVIILVIAIIIAYIMVIIFDNLMH